MPLKKLLIFDDEQDILQVASIMLRKDFEVHTQTHVEDVVGIVSLIKPDVILMDLWIPEKGGKFALDCLRNDSSTKDIPVLFFSANTDIAQIAEEAGANGYVSKPFIMKELKARLHATCI